MVSSVISFGEQYVLSTPRTRFLLLCPIAKARDKHNTSRLLPATALLTSSSVACLRAELTLRVGELGVLSLLKLLLLRCTSGLSVTWENTTSLVLEVLLNGRRRLDRPVKDVVVLEALTNKEVAEELAEVRVVGLVVKAERTAVVEVDGKLVGEATAEDVGRGGHLLLHDAVVLLLLGSSLKALPWQGAAQEVHEDITKRLEVVTTGLLDTEMGVDRRVTSSTSEVLVLTVGDVEMCLGVTVLLCETEIDDVDLVAALSDAHQEVVWLDVTVDEVARVDVLYARDQLVGEQQHSLEAELAIAEVEQILERWATAWLAI